MKETVESELCKRFYFAWIFNIESRDFASRLLFIETFSRLSTPSTIITVRERNSFLTLLSRKPICVFIFPLLAFSCCLFISLYLLSCLFYSDTHQLHINSKSKINNLSFSLFVKKFALYESYLPWKEFFSLFHYIKILWYIDILIHINCLFTHYLLRICYCIIAYYVNSTNKILIICLFHYYNEISLCI